MMYSKGTKIVTVVSDGSDYMFEFSEHNSVHDYLITGVIMKAKLVFPEDSRYAGPIVVYVTEDAEFWIEPAFQFYRDYTQC